MQTTENKPRLLDQVRNCMRLQRMSPNTINTYITWIKQFIHHHKLRHPAEMGVVEIGQFGSQGAIGAEKAEECD